MSRAAHLELLGYVRIKIEHPAGCSVAVAIYLEDRIEPFV